MLCDWGEPAGGEGAHQQHGDAGGVDEVQRQGAVPSRCAGVLHGVPH